MKIYFMILFVLLPIFTYGQKCKYYKDEIDPMTEQRVRICNNIVNRTSTKGFFNYKRTGDKFELILGITWVGDANYIIPNNSIVKVKFGDGTIHEFKSNKASEPTSYVVANQVYSQYVIFYDCKKNDLEELSKFGFSVVSTDLPAATLTYTVKPKKIIKTAQNAKCILED